MSDATEQALPNHELTTLKATAYDLIRNIERMSKMLDEINRKIIAIESRTSNQYGS